MHTKSRKCDELALRIVVFMLLSCFGRRQHLPLRGPEPSVVAVRRLPGPFVGMIRES